MQTKMSLKDKTKINVRFFMEINVNLTGPWPHILSQDFIKGLIVGSETDNLTLDKTQKLCETVFEQAGYSVSGSDGTCKILETFVEDESKGETDFGFDN